MKKKLKVLVVDDERSMTTLIKHILTPAGFEVIEVNSSAKVEDHILYTDLGLVITDLLMPGLDGLQVMELIKQSKPDLPVLMLTAHGSIDIAVKAIKMGAAEFLTKPLDRATLIRHVKNHINVDPILPEHILQLTAAGALRAKGQEVDPDKIVLKDEIVSFETIPDGYVELKFADIASGQVLPFALFIQIYNAGTKKHYLRKICHENAVYNDGLKQILEKKQLSSAYIKADDYGRFLEYLAALKVAPGVDQNTTSKEKQRLVYGKAVESVTEILAEPFDNKNVEGGIDMVDNMFHTMVEDPVVFHDIFKLFKRDAGIFSHSANVCLMAVSFGLYLGLDHKNVHQLGLGALFHDVGMNRVDSNILDKKTPLTTDEWREIKKHPEMGYDLLKSSVSVPLSSLHIVLEHHEAEDGSGYPRGLRGNNITKKALLFRVIDRFEGATTDQPYRKALSVSEALKRIYLEEPSEYWQMIITRFIEFLGGREKPDSELFSGDSWPNATEEMH